MNSKLQIFISSTYSDLIPERQAAIEAILESGNIPAGMELFTAGDRSQWEVIQQWINNSDVYMMILGGRYGSIEPSSGLSYTELEYNFAVSSRKPHFAVVINEDALEKRRKQLGDEVIEKDNPEKLKDFRARVLCKMSSFFSDHKDVKLAIFKTVPQLAQEHELKGWVRAEEVPDTKALADELSLLHAENNELREKLKKQTLEMNKTRSDQSTSEKEFLELFELLTTIEIDIKALKSLNHEMSELSDKVPLIGLAVAFRDTLMTGVTNQYGIDQYSSFIFFTLCPKLQTYGIVQNEAVPGASYRRYAITNKGTQFFAYVEKRLHKEKALKENSGRFGERKASTIEGF
jgi:hypothetical protein